MNVYIGAKEPLLAYAESSLRRDESAGRHLFSVETGTAIYQAMAEERRDSDLYESAKREGVDAATLTARFPVKVDPSNDWVGRLPDTARALGIDERDGKLRSESGIVKSVAPSKKAGPHGERLRKILDAKPKAARAPPPLDSTLHSEPSFA